jgi:hypothetical protein
MLDRPRPITWRRRLVRGTMSHAGSHGLSRLSPTWQLPRYTKQRSGLPDLKAPPRLVSSQRTAGMRLFIDELSLLVGLEARGLLCECPGPKGHRAHVWSSEEGLRPTKLAPNTDLKRLLVATYTVHFWGPHPSSLASLDGFSTSRLSAVRQTCPHPWQVPAEALSTSFCSDCGP